MPGRSIPQPTDAELEILRVLWEKGPSTVRQVFELLSHSRNTGYTTVLKFLQIMTEKGLVERDESQRSHVYKPKMPQDKTQQQLLQDLLKRAFAGSTASLMVSLLKSTDVDASELKELRRLINEKAKRQRP